MQIPPHDESKQLAKVPPAATWLRWIDIPEENRPFQDFKHEYLFSDYELDTITLVARWAGLHSSSEIQSFMNWPGIEEDRFNIRYYNPDITSDEFKLKLNRIWLMRFDAQGSRAAQKLKEGGDWETVEGKQEFVPLSARKRAALVGEQDSAFKNTRLLQDEATSIVSTRGKTAVITIEELVLQGAAGLSAKAQEAIQRRLNAIEAEVVETPSIEAQLNEANEGNQVKDEC